SQMSVAPPKPVTVDGRKYYDDVLVNGGAGTVPRGATPHATYLPPEQQMVVRGPGPSPPNSATGHRVYTQNGHTGGQQPVVVQGRPGEALAAPLPSLHHVRELIGLNVGGTHYVTLYETLARFRSPYFERLVTLNQTSGKIFQFDSNIIFDASGAIFINRDGGLFRYVLQYMRDGKNAVLPEDLALLRQLRREAEFFGLGGLKELVEEQIHIVKQRRDERDEVIQSLKATVSSISQSLYVTNFSRR
ncbi:hypothetical protein PRIPAC_72870, partial [Pristionchus pacificus]|uniref:BTB domain-containing protein n=1 Tax=Pristionchus pacificus TaxID=54126 RepID=A0A8R1V4L8_PRIPA